MSFQRNRTLKLERGLYLLEQRGGRTYAARTWVDGKWAYENLNTSDYHTAQQTALKWFRGLKSRRDKGETVAEAMRLYLASVHDEGKRQDYQWKWDAIKEFFAPGMGRPDVYVVEVDGPLLVKFIEWRREKNPDLTSSTLHKSLVTLRQALKHAVLRGVISAMPMFPGRHVVGKIESNPRPWFDPQEWARLLKVARQRVTNAPNVRTAAQREELVRFILFMHLTCLRVDEARAIRMKDCTIKSRWGRGVKVAKRGKQSATTISPEARYLEISVRESKTGPRTTISRPGAVYVFEELTKGKQPNDLLFTAHHRDAFRELLIAADLRTNAFGVRRNAKALRPTAISHWLIDKPTIPLSWLAANCGTSITMLQQFYVRRLGLQLDGLDWL